MEEYNRHIQMHIPSSTTETSYMKGGIRADSNEILHACYLCRENFKTSSELLFHSLKHPLGKTLRCRFCGIQLNKQTDVIPHEKECFKSKWGSIDYAFLLNRNYGGQMHDKTSEGIVKINKPNESSVSVEQSKKTQEPVLKCVHCNYQCKTHPQAIIHFLGSHYTSNKNLPARPTSGLCNKSLPRDPLARNRDDQSFYCDLCGHKMKLLSDLTAHIVNHLKIPFFCEICKSEFSTENEYKSHMRIQNANKFSCRRCGDVFETVIELESHRVVEHGKGNRHRSKSTLYPCHKCGKFIAKSALKRHMKLAHKEEKQEDAYLCKICGATYLTKSYYFNHMREHEGLKRLACRVCGQVFMSEENLENHKLTHPPIPRPYTCRYCDATFRNPTPRKRHENRKHIRNYSYKCSDCGMLFLESRKLKVHSVVHTKVKKFECTICDMKFTQKGGLGRHMRIHGEDKRHQCTECGRKFVQKYDLTRHMWVHTGEKPHKCLQCPLAFRQVFMLTQHVRKHHSSAE